MAQGSNKSEKVKVRFQESTYPYTISVPIDEQGRARQAVALKQVPENERDIGRTAMEAHSCHELPSLI